jgi:hypothetical protein
MSMEAPCTLRVNKEQFAGKARLDADHIDFVGQTKFRFRMAEIREPSFSSGILFFDFHGNKIALSVGERTAKWYDAVIHPKSPAEKMGVRAGMMVRLVNVDDPSIIESFEAKKAAFVSGRGDSCDMVLLGVERAVDLRQVSTLAESLEPDGVIWIILPKTARTVTRGNVVTAARNVRMMEMKSVSVSDTHMAYKISRPNPGRARRNGNGRSVRRAPVV